MTSRTPSALQWAFALFLASSIFSNAASADFADCGWPIETSNSANPIVELETPIGSICIELLQDVAPATVAHFLGYLDREEIAGTFFHFVEPGRVVSAGFRHESGQLLPVLEELEPPTADEACVPNEPVDPEDPEGPQQCSEGGNIAGTIGLEYLPAAPGSPSWYINISDNRSILDSVGLPIFGRVVGDGLILANAISNLQTYPAQLVYNSVSSDPQILVEGLIRLPVQSMPSDTPGEFGCFDVDDLVALGLPDLDLSSFDPANPGGTGFGATNDPLMPQGVRALGVSGGCGTFLASHEDFVANESENELCPTVDQFGIGMTDILTVPAPPLPQSRQFFRDAEGTLYVREAHLFYSFTCDEVEESLAELAMRRATMSQRIAANAITITSAVNLPEPDGAWLGATALVAIAWLRRRRGSRALPLVPITERSQAILELAIDGYRLESRRLHWNDR